MKDQNEKNKTRNVLLVSCLVALGFPALVVFGIIFTLFAVCSGALLFPDWFEWIFNLIDHWFA